MLITADTIEEIRSHQRPLVGFFGAPPRDILCDAVRRHDALLVDLDVAYRAPGTKTLPKAYCHIIRNCVDNALALRDELVCVVAATGREKCDAGRFAARLLEETLKAEVLFTENHRLGPRLPPLLSEARGSLKKRAVRIMRGIATDLDETERTEALEARCSATHGFWGTPPHPIALLDLFPETTHIFGWTRCVEMGRPADLALEMTVPADLPIVFFSQGFCQKAALAKHLAEKHRGIHVDCHDVMNAAVQAKIEAFIRLTGPGGVS
jgi:hypothetical protein